MRAILISTLALLLQGCWFVFIPGSVVSAVTDGISGNKGQNCVAESVKVGDSIRAPDGRVGKVQALEGFSSRCQTATPVRAVVTFDSIATAQVERGNMCVSDNSTVGTKISLPGGRTGTVREYIGYPKAANSPQLFELSCRSTHRNSSG